MDLCNPLKLRNLRGFFILMDYRMGMRDKSEKMEKAEREAYECGYEDGYEKAMEEMMGERSGYRSSYRSGYRGGR